MTRSSKRRQSGCLDEDFSIGKKGKISVADSETPEPQTQVTPRDQSTAGANASATETMSLAAAPLGSFQRRCNPIQALLAKSVGNKVTLISHPQVPVANQTLQCPKKTVSAALPPANPTAVCQPTQQQTPVSLQTHPSTTSSVQRPVQVVYKAPEGLSLVGNNSMPAKFSVQPVVHQKSGEKAMQQVIILPTNLLIQKTEEKRDQQPSSITVVSTTKPATLLSNTSGFTVPENKIPVQQVSPLKTISTVISSSAVSSSLQKSVSCGISPARKKTAEPSSTLKGSTTSTSATTEPTKCDLNQELKTVCIRDSQSILVTTRGGNTGVVKVQTSENSVASVLPSSPIFTLSPKFQAFFVSKASTVETPTAQTTTITTLLPIASSLNDQGISFNSAPQSPIKSSKPVNPPSLIERVSGPVPVHNDLPFPSRSVSDNATKSAQILIGNYSLVPANSQTSGSVPPSGWSVQTAASDNIIRHTQKRPQDTSADKNQSASQKVFVVASTTSVSSSVSSIATTSAASVFSGSSVKFMSQSGSTCSTITVPKGLVTSNIAVTTTSSPVDVINVRCNLGQAIGSTCAGTLTEVQGINVTGLAARILDRTTVTSKNTDEISTKVAPMMVSGALATSSGQIFVQNSNFAASSCLSQKINGPVKVTGSVDGKGVRFSAYDPGHMASSELLSAVQQKCVSPSVSTAISVSDILNKRSELVLGSSTPTIGCSVLGSPFNKGTSLPRRVMQDKPLGGTSLSTASTRVQPTVINSMTRVSQPLSLNTTTVKQVLDSPFTAIRSVRASTVRPPINTGPDTTTVQEKVVINTTGPLAPGTQLLINNTKFVVPAQGLAPGSHVLLISNPVVHPTGRLGANPLYPAPRMAGPLTPPSVSPVVQGLRMVTPGIRSQDTSVGQPTSITAKTEQSFSVNNLLTAVRPPPVSINSSTLAQVSSSSGQQSLTHIVRLPSFLLPEVKGYSAASSCIATNCPKENITLSAQSQRCLASMTTPDLLQTEPALAAPQLKSVVTSVKPVISWPTPVVTVSPLCSTISRMQTLPVATVPPTGSTNSSGQTTCVATVSPSVNTLLMSTCQPVRPVQPENIRMRVTGCAPQIQSKTVIQVSGGQAICTPSKLLLSPDGAILNVLKCPSLQNLPATRDKTTVDVTTSNAPVLHTLDATSDKPE